MANKHFLRFLGVTGVATIIVLVVPGSVALGVLLGGLPGLFLMIAPTLFMYLGPWWGLKWLVLKLGMIAGFDTASWPLRGTAILLPIAPILYAAFAIPAMINAPRERELVELQRRTCSPRASSSCLQPWQSSCLHPRTATFADASSAPPVKRFASACSTMALFPG